MNKTIQAVLPEPLKERLDKFAEEKGLTLSEAIRYILQSTLDKREGK